MVPDTINAFVCGMNVIVVIICWRRMRFVAWLNLAFAVMNGLAAWVF